MQKLFEKRAACLEVNLGYLENKYPTIPAIEVTIPHVLASLKFTLFKKYTSVQIKTYRYNNILTRNYKTATSKQAADKTFYACSLRTRGF
jgi:hypothetical protein